MLYSLRFHRVFLLRILLAMLLLTLSRICFGLFNPSTVDGSFLDLSLAAFRYDVATVCIFWSPVWLLMLYPSQLTINRFTEKFAVFFFHLISALCLLVNLIDTAWFPFTGKRSTTDVFRMMAQGDDIGNNLTGYLSDYWYILVIWLLLVWIGIRLYRKIGTAVSSTWPSPPRRITISVLLAGILFIAARGGLQMKPLSVQAAAGMVETKSIPLVLNTPYTLFKSIRDEVLPSELYLDEHTASRYFNLYKPAAGLPHANKRNVVLIILESFSAEYIGKLNGGLTYTPFLDSLMGHSHYWAHAFANGKRSVEGIPAVCASIPALMNEPFITSAWNANRINSLASLLTPLGYSSAFFHGGNNGTMGFDNFTKLAGYQSYIGKNEYDGPAEDYDGHWGIFDDAFYRFMIRKANAESTPFCYTFFSLSSHHPYTIPTALSNQFPEGKLPIHRSIRYADYSLRKFFESAQRTAWYNNTVFLITADHTGPSAGGYYSSPTGLFAIPIILFDPQENKEERIETVAQQCDILPTLLFKLEYTGSHASFGNNLFDASRLAFAINYASENWQLISDRFCIESDGKKARSVYRFPEDSLLRSDVSQTDSSYGKEELYILQSVLQQYRQGLIHNRLVKN